MSSKLVTDDQQVQSPPDDWRVGREKAPSAMRAQSTTIARMLGLCGLALATLGGVAWIAMSLGNASRIGPFWSTFCLIVGFAFLLIHAAVDVDVQIRRTYGVFGYVLIAAAIVVGVFPIKGPVGALFVPYGYLALWLALLFLFVFARNETEPAWHALAAGVLGLVGMGLAGVGFVGGTISGRFLLGDEQTAPYAALFLGLGLFYVGAFVVRKGTVTDLAYRTALAFGVSGAIFFLVALVRSLLPVIRHMPESYLIPSGLTLMSFGLLYAGVAAALCSENRSIVLFRRELAAFFYSPIAYIVLFCFALIAAWLFLQFVWELRDLSGQAIAREPVIIRYLLAWFPVISVVVAVPLLTMRLFSEEQRSGTMEVLLTAPVGETPVVLSKFFAALFFYMLFWLPWGICLIFFRVEGGKPFEYRPLLSFYLMQMVTGAAFVSMGLFFSSLTRNQIIAAVLTFMAMIFWTFLFFARRQLEEQPGMGTASGWVTVLAHVSYLDLWISSMQGRITPKFYIFPLSACILWLFLTVKVLEIRRWR
jgi:ABC-2 type transport system permease protein